MFDEKTGLHLNRKQQRLLKKSLKKHIKTDQDKVALNDYLDFMKNKGERNYV